jgi:hypothetical protein
MVHVLPVVPVELDELKRGGRIPEIHDAAPRADRRLKGLRDNGNVRVGARVAGDIYAAECPVRATGPGELREALQDLDRLLLVGRGFLLL